MLSLYLLLKRTLPLTRILGEDISQMCKRLSSIC